MPEKINIPEPCSVQWNQMTPIDQSKRHCLSCQTPVVDFTKKSLEEIHDFFRDPANQNVCGRYNQKHTTYSAVLINKMNRIEVFFSRFKMRRIALLLIGGILLLSSCHRHVRGKRKKVGIRTSTVKTEQTSKSQNLTGRM